MSSAIRSLMPALRYVNRFDMSPTVINDAYDIDNMPINAYDGAADAADY